MLGGTLGGLVFDVQRSTEADVIETDLLAGWPGPLAARLGERLAAWGRSDARPVAVLDFDNTCIRGDLGESLHRHLCERLAYALDDEQFWATLDPADGRDRLRDAWGQRDTAGWDRERFVVDLMATYARRLIRTGPAGAYGWATTLHAGLAPGALEWFAGDVFALEQGRASAHRSATAPDGVHVRIADGLAIRPAIVDLVRALDAIGAEVWIVSATCEWGVRAAAPSVGVPVDRVIGNRCRVVDGRITAEREGPTTWRGGKVDAIRQRIARRPVLAIGDAWTDAEMLEHASEVAILIDRGDVSLRDHATRLDWFVVPAEHLDGDDPAR